MTMGGDAGLAQHAQAHLTPHHRQKRTNESPTSSPSTSRPSRNRRPPAWLENDGIVTMADRSAGNNAQRPSKQVVVEMKKDPNLTASPSKKSFRNMSSNTRSSKVVFGGARNRLQTSTTDDDDASDSTGSSSSSSEDEDGPSQPHTPSKRSAARVAVLNDSPSTSKRQQPRSASSLATSKGGISLPTNTSQIVRRPSNPSESRPRPIKRPRLSRDPPSGQLPRSATKPSTPRKTTKATSLPNSQDLAPSPLSVAASQPFVQPTSADFYFAAHTSRRKASTQANTSWTSKNDTNLLEGLHSLPALTAKQVATYSRSGSREEPLSVAGLQSLSESCYHPQFKTWKSLLLMGNELMFNGVGSIESVLDAFVRQLVDDDDDGSDDVDNGGGLSIDAVSIRGRTAVRSEEWIARIEQTLGIHHSDTGLSSDARIIRVRSWLSEHQNGHLVVMIHSLDSPSFLNPRTRSHLQLLTSSPFVHLLASTSHPNAHFLDGFVRHPNKRLLWIPCSTLAPMLDDALLSGAGVKLGGLPRQFDLLTGSGGVSRIVTPGDAGATRHPGHDGAAASAASLATQANAPPLTSTSATHVLKSVTTKARALFISLANELFKSTQQPSEGQTPFPQRSIPYPRLQQLASRNFLASSEAVLRALLVEFTSHGLVKLSRQSDPASGGGGVEVISVRIATVEEVKEVIEACKKM